MLPWVKVDHITYRHSEFRAKASMQARYAYHELVTIAPLQTPALSIPNDDEVIAGWLNVSVKQWLKVRDLVLSQFTRGDDGRFYCDMLVELYSNQREAKQDDHQQDNNQDNDKPLTNAERCRRYRNNRNNTSDMSTDTTADTVNMSTDTTATRDRHNEKVSQHESNMSKSDEMGGRGEDLDSELKQDLDKEQEVKTKTPRGASVSDARFDEFWIQYPRKENKQGALKAWKKLKPSESLYQQIILAVATQKTWPSWMSGYAPHAMTWLNGSRWDDQQANIIPMPNKPKQPSQMTDAERKAAHDQMTREAKRMVFGDSDDDFIDGVASHV